MQVRKLLRGKFDSQFKFDFNVNTNKTMKVKIRGHFCGAMDYACRIKGGMAAIDEIRFRPRRTWQAY